MKKRGKSFRKLALEEEMSEERTLLSIERTLLSYIRTAFAVIVAGVAIIGFFREGIINILGIIILSVGILFLIVGVIYYFYRKKKLEEEWIDQS